MNGIRVALMAGALAGVLVQAGCVTSQRRVYTRHEVYGPGGQSMGSSVYEERVESGPHFDIRYQDSNTRVRARQ